MVNAHIVDFHAFVCVGLFLYHLYCNYSKCSKISNIFLVPFANIMLIIEAEICKMLVRIANREDPDQTASSEAV